jgi:hypothetical protein
MFGAILPVQQLQQSKTCTLSVFHIRHIQQTFWLLKEAMGGKKFRSDEEVQQAVHECLRRQPQESIHFVNAGGPALNKMETV